MTLVVRAAALLAAGSWCAVVTSVARGTDVVEYNFNTGPADWTSPEGEWLYTAEGSNEKSWKLLLTGSNPSVNELLSPCFTITATTVRFDLQQHRFAFGFSGTVPPLAYAPPAGQVQYAFGETGPWHGIPLEAWSPFVGPGGGGDTPPTLDVAALPAGAAPGLAADGWAFQGLSPGVDAKNPTFIRSAFELAGLTPGDHLRFRFVGDLGVKPSLAGLGGPIWDVNQLQIKGAAAGVCAPEPSGAALAAMAAAVSSAAWWGRSRGTRRRCRRPCSGSRQSPAPGASA